ncbi:hypothetical protein Fot_03708 [Forsythia ovata]|uniref:Uncharacterized protein n=1 Tax=Forsythia ovata TaxID=205694 RepID=A0ABD1XAH8_9LAMI
MAMENDGATQINEQTVCLCGWIAAIRIAWTENNPGRSCFGEEVATKGIISSVCVGNACVGGFGSIRIVVMRWELKLWVKLVDHFGFYGSVDLCILTVIFCNCVSARGLASVVDGRMK